jgi:hypothetical protein
MLRRPPRKPIASSAVEIEFAPTPDGLVVDRVILKPATPDAERDLRLFLDRFRDPDLDLNTITGTP